MERQEQLRDLRARILQAEEDRLHDAKAMSIAEAREALKKEPTSLYADDRFGDCETRGTDGMEDYPSPSKV